MDSEADIRAVAARLFDAIEQGDIATMQDSFTPDAEIWHNTDEKIVTPAQTAVVLGGMCERISDRSYANRRINLFPGGFVQQHDLEGTRVHDGERLHMPVCIVCQVRDGKITRLDEYFDRAMVAEFRRFA